MSSENERLFLADIKAAKAVADALPEGYTLADVYLRLGNASQSKALLTITAQALRDLSEKTLVIARAMEGRI